MSCDAHGHPDPARNDRPRKQAPSDHAYFITMAYASFAPNDGTTLVSMKYLGQAVARNRIGRDDLDVPRQLGDPTGKGLHAAIMRHARRRASVVHSRRS